DPDGQPLSPHLRRLPGLKDQDAGLRRHVADGVGLAPEERGAGFVPHFGQTQTLRSDPLLEVLARREDRIAELPGLRAPYRTIHREDPEQVEVRLLPPGVEPPVMRVLPRSRRLLVQ